jgi:uncharacterized membrane protein (UPF0127 family)
MVALINERTDVPVATAVELATTRRERRKGLLGRNSLDSQAAIVLVPCAAVHTAFMRFPIDVVFIDRGGRAVRIVHDLQPWRIAASRKAHSVIELAAGKARQAGIHVGDRLYLSGPDHPSSRAC